MTNLKKIARDHLAAPAESFPPPPPGYLDIDPLLASLIIAQFTQDGDLADD